MHLEHLQFLIAGYILGNLNAAEAAELQRLLTDDPAITSEAEKIQKTLELVYASAEVQPPTYLRAAILNANPQLNSIRSNPTHNPSPTARFFIHPYRWTSAIRIAAAVAIVVLSFNNYHLWSALQATRQISQPVLPNNPEPMTYALQSTSIASTATATVVVNPSRLDAVLTAQNLPPLPPGKTYVLWTIVKPDAPFTKDKKASILTGVFQVDAEGSTSQTVTLPSVYRSKDLVVRVAVTIEDVTAPQKHAGTPILSTAL